MLVREHIISKPFPSWFLAFALRFAALLVPGGCEVLTGELGVRSGGFGWDEQFGQGAVPGSDPLILSKPFSSTSVIFPLRFYQRGLLSQTFASSPPQGCPSRAVRQPKETMQRRQ